MELIDIVDPNDIVLHQGDRQAVFEMVEAGTWPEGRYFRCVIALAVNSRREYLFLRRRPDKWMYPNALDYSLCEQVQAGETYEGAFRRGIGEELGLEWRSATYKFITLLPPNPDQKIFWFTALYRIQLEQTPEFSRKDFVRAAWMSRDAIQDRLGGALGPPLFRRGIREVLEVF